MKLVADSADGWHHVLYDDGSRMDSFTYTDIYGNQVTIVKYFNKFGQQIGGDIITKYKDGSVQTYSTYKDDNGNVVQINLIQQPDGHYSKVTTINDSKDSNHTTVTTEEGKDGVPAITVVEDKHYLGNGNWNIVVSITQWDNNTENISDYTGDSDDWVQDWLHGGLQSNIEITWDNDNKYVTWFYKTPEGQWHKEKAVLPKQKMMEVAAGYFPSTTSLSNPSPGSPPGPGKHRGKKGSFGDTHDALQTYLVQSNPRLLLLGNLPHLLPRATLPVPKVSQPAIGSDIPLDTDDTIVSQSDLEKTESKGSPATGPRFVIPSNSDWSGRKEFIDDRWQLQLHASDQYHPTVPGVPSFTGINSGLTGSIGQPQQQPIGSTNGAIPPSGSIPPVPVRPIPVLSLPGSNTRTLPNTVPNVR